MAVKTDYKAGDKVVFVDKKKHEEHPEFYPEVGTVGTVLGRYTNVCTLVKWEEGSTTKDDTWNCEFDWIIPAKEYFKKEKEKGNMKKNSRKFKVGDRVRVIKDCDGAKKGMVGTIAVVDKSTLKTIGVKFDKKLYGGHSLAGKCEHGYGHWVYPDCIELISGNKIVITADGATTTARFYDGEKVIKAAKAECSPEDEFDFKTGAKIAFDRLVDNEIKNPRKYYDGKVVFSENTGDFKKGVLYVFRSNGDVEDFFGNPVFSHGQKITHTYNSFSDIDGFYGDIVDEVK